MTELTKKSTLYSVKNVGSTLAANGNCTIGENKFIESMYITFTDNEKPVGSANYSENENNSSYNYSLTDEKYKKEVTTMLDAIIADIKAQIAKA